MTGSLTILHGRGYLKSRHERIRATLLSYILYLVFPSWIDISVISDLIKTCISQFLIRTRLTSLQQENLNWGEMIGPME